MLDHPVVLAGADSSGAGDGGLFALRADPRDR